MDALTWSAAGGAWRLRPVTDAVLLVTAGLYLRRARHGWPIGRTLCFLGALALVAVTLQSSIDVYGHELFWMHMIEHLLLIMCVPVLFVLGQPIRLLTTETT